MSEDRTQLTVRAAVAGMLLGGVMSLSNLYVALKTGWTFGVSITAGILAFAIFAALHKVGASKKPFGILENNAMQSVASAAGYMTGGGTVAAIPALMMITGEPMVWTTMMPWIASIAALGVVMAIPMKQQMIDVEGLRFPSGIAAAETLRALHGDADSGGQEKARFLGVSAFIGAFVAFFRDAKAAWIPYNFLEKVTLPGLTLGGRRIWEYTISFETSLLLVGGGAIMGWRAAWSLLLGAGINYLILVPRMYELGAIDPKLGYKNIVAWSVWFGSTTILTSGLLSFAFQWRTVMRAMQSVSAAMKVDAVDDGQVPMRWFFIGMAIFAPIVIFLEWLFFGIAPWLGVISVVLGFFIAIVACRATGETDTTPTGALGKITQITFGALDPGNTTTNLMTAHVTGGAGLHAADLLTDLKSGYILGADPKQQFWAQFLGVLAGSVFVVPAYRLLIPTADLIGTDKWPAPGAQTWKGVALLLANGLSSLHYTAQISIVVGAVVGVALVLLDRFLPRLRHLIPSAMGFGLAFTLPVYNTLAMFLGASIAMILERTRPALAERTVVPVSSGFIAGESLMGIAVAIAVVSGLLHG